MEYSPFSFPYLLIIISLIIFPFSLNPVKSQEITLSEESQLLNNCISSFNKTEKLFLELMEKIELIKYNLILRIQIKALIGKHNKIEEKLKKFQETINTNINGNNTIISELKELYEIIEKYERNCNKTLRMYKNNNKISNIISDFLKVFFITLLIVAIIILIMIGIISIFVVKKQRKFYKLEEEVTNPDDIGLPKLENPDFKKITEEKGETSSGRNIVISKKTEQEEQEQKQEQKQEQGKS